MAGSASVCGNVILLDGVPLRRLRFSSSIRQAGWIGKRAGPIERSDLIPSIVSSVGRTLALLSLAYMSPAHESGPRRRGQQGRPRKPHSDTETT